MSDLTRISLAMALEELLKEKPLSQLTVKGVCERAGINRQTFYYHFENLSDLLLWGASFGVSRMEKELNAQSFSSRSFLMSFVDSLKANRQVLLNLYNSIDGHTFHQYAIKFFEPLMYKTLGEHTKGYALDEASLEALRAYYRNFFIGFLVSWLECNDGLDDEEVLSKFIDFGEISLAAITEKLGRK